jgi:hypothetical protein
MPKKKPRQFYVPVMDFWRWEQLTDTFLQVQLKRVRASYDETERFLDGLDARGNDLAKFVRENWPNPHGNLRQIVETEAKAIKDERKRVLGVQERIVLVLGRIKSELKTRKIDTDRKLMV